MRDSSHKTAVGLQNDSALDDTHASTAVGLLLGSYRVCRFIAQGGMGAVFEAEHAASGERVALKILHSGGRPSISASQRKRFVTETRALLRLSHPSLVRFFDCGETEEGLPWFAMELLSGESLRARIERHTSRESFLPAEEIVRIARQIVEAIEAIHAMGVVHRDLKPDNIMLVADSSAPAGERVKVVDFGIAKMLDADTPLTTEGVALGTATYMAPEQCVGNATLDGSADLYAFGVILYELLSGAPPFRGDVATVMRQHIFAAPPPLAPRDPEAPQGLVDLCEALLAKEPSRRPLPSEVRDTLASTPITLKRRSWARDAESTATRTDERVPVRHSALELAPTERREVVETENTGQKRSSRPRWMAAAALLLFTVASAAIFSLRRPAQSTSETPTLPGMVRIAGGRFRMGSSAEEIEAACKTLPGGCAEEEMPQLFREKPIREVEVSSFQIDANEVDNRSFASFLNTLGPELDTREDRDEHFKRFVTERVSGLLLADLHPLAGGIELQSNGLFVPRQGRERLPAVQITWDGASRYCRHLGKRLPTEAEWELAARGKERRTFPWGDKPPQCEGVAFGRGEARGCSDREAKLAPVGSSLLDQTPDGVRDLGGNAGEWVQDQFLLPYYEACGDCVDPVVEKPMPATDDFRIFRGGTFRGVAWVSRGATRSRWRRTDVMDGIGVRCATR